MLQFSDPQDPMWFTILNPAAENQPQIFTGVKAVLNVSIDNATGGDITMSSGDEASTIEVFMPDFFTSTDVGNMKVTDISQEGWTFSSDAPSNGLLLTFTGSDGKWPNGTKLTFNIQDVVSNADPTIDKVTVNTNNLGGDNVPLGLEPQNLALANAVAPPHNDLTTVLLVNLDNQGTVYVSDQTDPLPNTIYLNFKNICANPLYDDKKNIWTGNPTVTVAFLYGSTAGALTPDHDPPAAWKISVSVDTNQKWGFHNPVNTGQKEAPIWKLFPNPSNQEIIGTGENANVTFAFTNINSFAPTGHTQMYVQFTGFMADSKTPYKPALFIVDIVKQTVPPIRGLLGFSSTQAGIVSLTAPVKNIEIPLRWSMFYVDNINLICNIPGVHPLNKNYFKSDQPSNLDALAYDDYTLTIPVAISQNTPVFITIQAFDNNGGFLNAMQFTVFISVDFFEDPVGNIYPTIFINDQTWLAANYNFAPPSGSVPYGNVTGNQKQYGLLYTFPAAQSATPAGWRIPTQSDWQNLIDSLGKDAFNALMAPKGETHFNAQAGGMCDNLGNFSGMDSPAAGYYWTSTQDSQNSGNYFYVKFFMDHQSVNADNSMAPDDFLSLRYVKNT
jgi:uncharacterized protein (TIGR02145 family)